MGITIRASKYGTCTDVSNAGSTWTGTSVNGIYPRGHQRGKNEAIAFLGTVSKAAEENRQVMSWQCNLKINTQVLCPAYMYQAVVVKVNTDASHQREWYHHRA